MSQKTHVLVVEDSPDDREMYTEYLSLKGYRVSVASDGKEALEKALHLHPELVLMDLGLPKIEGGAAMHLMKSDARTRNIPVVIITGRPPSRMRDCAGWLTKPCPLDQLDAEITRVLETRS